jgi:uncharacterized repeat protein (TIGR03837 family)
MSAPPTGPLWDVFCRVIDNRGDAGVAWRLARNLAMRGQRVRLWIDERVALAGMADAHDDALVAAGTVEVRDWADADRHDFDAPAGGLGQRLVEMFGCEPPDAVVAARGRRQPPPPWINLEYLSAESYVERSHGLRSPILAGPAQGQERWFFFPGFTPRTGGLLREPGLAEARRNHAVSDWWPASAGERPARIGSLFHYPLAGPLAGWPEAFAARSGRGWGWIRPGRQVGGPDACEASGGPVRSWPWLTQSGYDRLLWSCELNVVRGEDSFVRAQWAARPFVWQAYPQADGAHQAKVEAFLDRYLEDVESPHLAEAVRLAFRALNGSQPAGRLVPAIERALQPAAGWARHARRWAEALERQADLASQVIAFADRHDGYRPPAPRGSQAAGSAGLE